MNNRSTCRKLSGAAAVFVILAYAAQNASRVGRNFSVAGILATGAFLCLLTGMTFILVGLVAKAPRTVFAGGCITCGHFLLDLFVSGSFTGFGGYSEVTNTYFVSRFIILLSTAAFSYMVYKVSGGKLPENMRRFWALPAVGVLAGSFYYATLMSMRSGLSAFYGVLDFFRDLIWDDLFLLLLAVLYFLLLRSYTLDEAPVPEKKAAPQRTAPQQRARAAAPQQRARAAAPMSEKEIIEKLVKLKELLDEGIITEEEFTRKKKEYLAMNTRSTRVL